MKLIMHTTNEYKNMSHIPVLHTLTRVRGQMIAPGASSCTLGCSCSCSCGAVNTKH